MRPVFSWSAFAAAQVLIDCETLYYLVRREYPVHRVFHSFLGAAAVGMIAAMLFVVIGRVLARGGSGRLTPLVRFVSTAHGEFSPRGAVIGGLAGGLSHPFLDGIMHPDVRPFMPWADHNPFLGLIEVEQFHLACIAAALLGAVGVRLWERAVEKSLTGAL